MKFFIGEVVKVNCKNLIGEGVISGKMIDHPSDGIYWVVKMCGSERVVNARESLLNEIPIVTFFRTNFFKILDLE
ncbi:hypothetical protein LCGC14_1087850 [marine sediment metagenome]|uniref:Uncharacterized protein n=1 Tax=marine sediment metagenome TaxID=412755 RepID=A0A0F9PWG4_9ZZZZ